MKPGPDDAEIAAAEARHSAVRDELQATWALVQEGAIDEVCILAVGDMGVEILNTIPDLGELALARDELTDMINEARRGPEFED